MDYQRAPAYRPPGPEGSDGVSFTIWFTLVALVSVLGVLVYFIFFYESASSGKPGLELRPRSDAASASPGPEHAGVQAPTPAESLQPKSASGPLISGGASEPVGGAAEPRVPAGSSPAQGLREPGLSPPPSPRRQSASAAQLAELLSQGEGAIESGDIAAARAYYEAAYDAGSAEAATALGRTYDPLFLREKETLGLKADPSKAMQWYRLGVTKGDPVARLRLDALRSWLGQTKEREAQRPRGDP